MIEEVAVAPVDTEKVKYLQVMVVTLTQLHQ
jgi:hypothetical protein